MPKYLIPFYAKDRNSLSHNSPPPIALGASANWAVNACATKLSESQNRWPGRFNLDCDIDIYLKKTDAHIHSLTFAELNRIALERSNLNTEGTLHKKCPVPDTETVGIFAFAPVVFALTAILLDAPGSHILLKYAAPPLAIIIGGYTSLHLISKGWKENRHPAQKMLLYIVAFILLYELWIFLSV